MKNQWINFFSGSVRVSITGKGVERVINECVRRQIMVWEVKKHGTHSLSFYIHLKDISKIRPIIRKSDCKLRFVGRKGMPFIIRKTILNSGFLIGTILFLMIITFLSNMVWGIQVDGAKPETEHLIRKELESMGIERGKFQFSLTDVESIQRQLTNSIEQLTWVGVELKGTTYHFTVVEKNQPEPPDYYSPRNLVAKKKAVITRLFVEEGQPLVSVHDVVEKGQVLVSGEIGKDGQKPEYVPARGEIFGETWYESIVKVNLSSKFKVFTGNNITKHFIKFWDFSLPIWGFKNVEYKSYKTETVEKNIKFLKWTLPISYKKDIILENEDVERNYTIEEAVEAAKEKGRNDLEDKLDEDATIKHENVLRQMANNGKVILIIKYDVIENIVEPIPLVQGD